VEHTTGNAVAYTWFGTRPHANLDISTLKGEGFTLDFAVSRADREAVYRFRYRVYVEEMGRQQTYADHDAKTICEPLDEFGALVVARDPNGRVVGSVRINQANDPHIGYYRDLYQMDSFAPHYPHKVWVVTKLMVNQSLRSVSHVAIALAKACALMNYVAPNKFTLIDCNDYLVPYFERMGFCEYGKACHPEFGDVCLMSIDYEDQEYLARIASILAVENLTRNQAGIATV